MWRIWYRRTKWYTLVFGFIVLGAMAILLGIPKTFHKIWKVDNIPEESVRLMNTILHYHEKPEAEKRIPKIIHQVWDDEYIPEVFVKNMKGLVVHNKPPEWKYMFWTHANGQKLIENEYPRLLKLFLNSIKVMRANLIRLVVIHHYGGVYFDLDTVSVKPLDPFVETHNCSFVTDPDEHVFYPNQPTKMLLITNSALFCGPGHWFIKDIIEKLYYQPLSCRQSIPCSGPFFISKHYEILQRTNMSRHLPPIVDNRLFEDMVDPGRHKALEESCIEPFTNIKYEWAREVCRNWIQRGREKRNISELAFTYHTWYHTGIRSKELKTMKRRKITDFMENVKPLYYMYIDEEKGKHDRRLLRIFHERNKHAGSWARRSHIQSRGWRELADTKGYQNV